MSIGKKYYILEGENRLLYNKTQAKLDMRKRLRLEKEVESCIHTVWQFVKMKK